MYLMREKSKALAKLTSLSLDKFLEKLGSADPAPGGGAAAALVLAEATALGEMVARLNLKRAKKQNLKNSSSSKNSASLAGIRKKMLLLLDQDSQVFSVLSKFKKEDRVKSAYQQILKTAATIPYQMCLLAEKGILLALLEKPNTSAWLSSDLLEASILFKAGFAAARLNVDINLSHITDKKFTIKMKAQLNRSVQNIGQARKKMGAR